MLGEEQTQRDADYNNLVYVRMCVKASSRMDLE